jgi:hypothetical protein
LVPAVSGPSYYLKTTSTERRLNALPRPGGVDGDGHQGGNDGPFPVQPQPVEGGVNIVSADDSNLPDLPLLVTPALAMAAGAAGPTRATVAAPGATVVTGTTVVTRPAEPTVVTGTTMVTVPTAVTEPTAVTPKVVVAVSPVPVVAPTRVPKVTWAPLGERTWLSLRLRPHT